MHIVPKLFSLLHYLDTTSGLKEMGLYGLCVALAVLRGSERPHWCGESIPKSSSKNLFLCLDFTSSFEMSVSLPVPGDHFLPSSEHLRDPGPFSGCRRISRCCAGLVSMITFFTRKKWGTGWSLATCYCSDML